MNLNTDISKIFKNKKEEYPSKQDMNLFFKVDKTTAPTTALLYILFIVVLVLGASKIFIYDKINNVAELRALSENLDSKISDYNNKLEVYNDTLEEYIRYAPSEQELLLVDRIEILNVIDNVIRPKANISDISIEENNVLVIFSGVTLNETAQIVAALEQSPIVKKTSVDTAFSSEGNRDMVDVSIYIEVLKEGE